MSMPPSRRLGGFAVLVRNPFVIIAAAIVVGVSALALALFTTGGIDGRAVPVSGGEVVPSRELPPAPTVNARVRAGATVNVRTGAGNTYPVLGTLRRGQELDIIGRSSDGEWLLITYPPGSAQHGWIPVSALERPESARTLPVVTPTTVAVMVETPVSTPSLARATPEPTIGLTSPADLAPDLVIVAVDILSDGRPVVTVRNQGPGPVEGRPVEVALVSAAGQVLRLAGTDVRILAPGQALDIVINYTVTQPMPVRVIVDPNRRIEEVTTSNNIYDGFVQPRALPVTQATVEATPAPVPAGGAANGMATATPTPVVTAASTPASSLTPVPTLPPVLPTTVATRVSTQVIPRPNQVMPTPTTQANGAR